MKTNLLLECSPSVRPGLNSTASEIPRARGTRLKVAQEGPKKMHTDIFRRCFIEVPFGCRRPTGRPGDAPVHTSTDSSTTAPCAKQQQGGWPHLATVRFVCAFCPFCLCRKSGRHAHSSACGRGGSTGYPGAGRRHALLRCQNESDRRLCVLAPTRFRYLIAHHSKH